MYAYKPSITALDLQHNYSEIILYKLLVKKLETIFIHKNNLPNKHF